MIRTKLTIWNCLVLAVVLTATGVAIFVSTQRRILGALDERLLERADMFSTTWPGPPSRRVPHAPLPDELLSGKGRVVRGMGFDSGHGEGISFSVQGLRTQGIDPVQVRTAGVMSSTLMPVVLSMDGDGVMVDSQKPWSREAFLRARQGARTFERVMQDGVPLRVLSFPLLKQGKIVNVVQMAVPMAAQEEQLRSLAATLLTVLPSAVVVMLFIGVVLTRQALRPIARISAAAEQFDARNLGERLPVVGHDEFAQLSSTFNKMLGRLQTTFEEKDELYKRLRRFTADASHELKTPLTAVRVRTDLAVATKDPAKLTEHLVAIDQATSLMTSIVHGLLLLAASDEGRLNLQFDRVLASELVRDAVASVDGSGHDIRIHCDAGLIVECDAASIVRVLVNLLQNSVDHTDAGKRISVDVQFMPGEKIQFVVSDEGEGIPKEHASLVFNRFYRVDSSRDRESGGTGLGLAIAKAIVEAHKGRIWLESTLGAGTTAKFELPVVSPRGDLHPSFIRLPAPFT